MKLLTMDGLSHYHEKIKNYIITYVTSVLPTKLSSLTDDLGIKTHISNKSNPHGVTTTQIGAVPTTRTINSKALSANITLTYSDVGADASGSANSALSSAKTYADGLITKLIGDSPETLDTIYELADAVSDNKELITDLTTAVNSLDLQSITSTEIDTLFSS